MADAQGAKIYGGLVVPSDLHINTENYLRWRQGGRPGLSARTELVYPASLDLVCGEGQSYH